MIKTSVFGTLDDGREVVAYTMTNKAGASVTILNYGGIVQSLNIPDRNGKIDDIVCGYDDIKGYLVSAGYQGALIGRYGNRIADGRFTLNGVEYILAKNERGVSHLHGGNEGFDKKMWTVTPSQFDDCDKLTLEYTSPDGEEGFPGTLKVTVTYTFDNANTLSINYKAISDKDTICNLTNHSYFNLSGYAVCDIKNHLCHINSDCITEVDENLIPTGKDYAVRGTMFDLTSLTPMTEYIDHNYVLKNEGRFEKAAEVREEERGRCMEVWTDCPSLQLYTGNVMNGEYPFKGGRKQTVHHAFCMETQYAPDSPNQPHFPSCTLRANELYDFTTEYRFKTI